MLKPVLAALLLTAAPVATPVATPVAAAKPDTAALLAGTVTGKPVNCLSLRSIQQLKIVDERTLIAKVSARKYYRNDLPARCTALRRDRALKYKTSGSSLCSMDLITPFDAVSGIDYGSCGLGRFTPYALPEGVRF